MNPGTFTRKSTLLIILTLFLLILTPFTSTIARAAVTDLKVTPHVADPGDVISITGKASPNEAVWLSSSFELPLTVSEGKYSREFTNIHFPAGEKEELGTQRFGIRRSGILITQNTDESIYRKKIKNLNG
jgi:hypothetical protein